MTYSPTTWLDFPDTSTAITAARLNNMEDGIANAVENANPVQIGTAINIDSRPKQLQLSQDYESESTGIFGQYIEARVRGTSTAGPAKALFGLAVGIQDHSSVGTWNVTGAANNGSGLIRITAAGHTITTGDSVGVYGVGGTTEANGQWIATVISSSLIDLQGSTFTNTYTSGGKITNRGAYYGGFFGLAPSSTRDGGLTGTALHGDDVNGVGVFNGGTVPATAAYLVNRNSAFGSASEFYAAFSVEANADVGLKMVGDYVWGIDLYGDGAASFSSGAIRLKNNSSVYGRNAADSADVALFRIRNDTNELEFQTASRASGNLTFTDGVNIDLGPTNGTKIGLSTSQKLGFWNATPVVQPTAIADADGTLADITTKFNSLLTKLETIGLIAA